MDNVDNKAIQSNIYSVASLLIWVLAIVLVVVILLAVFPMGRRKLPPPT
ncbi:MAG: hypothetical protein ACUVQY_02390 [Thermoproteota archaeon]